MASQGPNIGVGMVCIHHVITRGLGVALDYTTKFAEEGFPNAERRDGFIHYLRSLASVLHGHHMTEDELAFPGFRAKFPDAPYEVLTGHHGTIAESLVKLNGLIELYAQNPEQSDLLKDIHKALREIDTVWHRHIALEEEHFTVEKLGLAFAPDEHTAMGRQFSEHTQKLTGPDYMLVPFILYNLAPDERALMAGMMPPVLTERLVPVDWKEKWSPMQPFFLS